MFTWVPGQGSKRGTQVNQNFTYLDLHGSPGELGGLRDSDAKCVLFAGAQNAEDIAFGRIVFSEKKDTLST